jgi:hypothetical protein
MHLIQQYPFMDLFETRTLSTDKDPYASIEKTPGDEKSAYSD